MQYYLILENSVEREKDAQVIDVNKEATKKRPTLLVRSSFLAFLGILRTRVDFRVSTDFSRFI